MGIYRENGFLHSGILKENVKILIILKVVEEWKLIVYSIYLIWQDNINKVIVAVDLWKVSAYCNNEHFLNQAESSVRWNSWYTVCYDMSSVEDGHDLSKRSTRERRFCSCKVINSVRTVSSQTVVLYWDRNNRCTRMVHTRWVIWDHMKTI